MDSQTEEWRPIAGYEGYYSVSNHGRIRSEHRVIKHEKSKTQTVKEKIMSPARKRTGHKSVMLYGPSKVAKRLHVHRLVMLAFTDGPPSDLHEVAHNDGNAENNLLSNLRWATTSSNMRDKVSHGTHNRGERHPNCTISSATVAAIRQESGRCADIGAKYGLPFQTVWAIQKRKTRIYD